MSDKDQLISAIKEGELETAKSILAAHPALAKGGDENGVSLILLALYYQRAEISQALRTQVDTVDGFEAAALGEVEVLRDLFGSAPDFSQQHAADGFTPLHLAAYFRQPAAARFLLAHGADPDAITNNAANLRPIHSACAAKHAGLVRILLAAGADPDHRQDGGHTALHAAALHGDEAIIRTLISAGAKRDIQNDEGKTPVDLLPDDFAHLGKLFSR